MKIEEKIKSKFLYSDGLNLFKIFYYYFQFLKSKLKPRVITANWGLDLIINVILKKIKQ